MKSSIALSAIARRILHEANVFDELSPQITNLEPKLMVVMALRISVSRNGPIGDVNQPSPQSLSMIGANHEIRQ
jgi:hypothetical protein